MIRILVVLTSVLILAAGCSQWRQAGVSQSPTPASQIETKRIASVDVVKAEPQALEINAGTSAQMVLRLSIREGYHVNANPPTYPYLKPTELELSPVEGISIGSVSYPAALEREFPFAEKAIAVYEGETELKVSVKTSKSSPRGQRSIPAVLRVQACDDQVCYPPGKIDLQIPVTIK